MNTRRIVLAVVAIGLVTITIGSIIYYKVGSDAATTTLASAAVPQRVSIVNGLTTVMLDTAIQAQSGIRSEPLAATNHQADVTAYGTVLDLQPLIDLRTHYMSAQADADATAASAAASRMEFERNRILYQDNQNVSLKTYQTAQAAYLSDQAKMQAASTNTQNVRATARQQFGETLGRWALDAHSLQLERLLNRQEVLLRVTVPLGDNVQIPATIQVAANNTQRAPAYLVSPATQSDPAVQGRAYIYRTAAPIAVGTNVAAYLPTSTQTTQGTFIPASAIVWYGGQPWAYVQTRPDRFARRPVSQHTPLDGGFFVTESIAPGEHVVVRGAQLLLSEELRPPPGTSGCKDPECD
ncbi:MAG: metal transporter [Glaciimonas sp.]|nr:metal transporter [Glaciimonas sp.]